jgi:transposase
VVLTGAHVHDSQALAALLEARVLPAAVLEPDPTTPLAAAEPHPELAHLSLDQAYRGEACAETAAQHGYLVHVAPPGYVGGGAPPDGSADRHPARRWVIEPAHSWFNRFRRLLTRWDKRPAAYLGFCSLAAVLIIYKKIRRRRELLG